MLEFIKDTAREISETIDGWCGAHGASLIPVGYMVSNGKGNHLEIGSLWGASAIMAAKVQELKYPDAKVYCVDPMEYKWHEPCSRRAGNVTPERAKIMRDVFLSNINKMGVADRIVLINKKSQPVPEEVKAVRFSTVFIDGWHYGNTPLMDAKSSSDMAEDFILLDDTPLPYYPSIERAFRWMVSNKKWLMVDKYDRSVLFMKRPKISNIWSHTAKPIDPTHVRGI